VHVKNDTATTELAYENEEGILQPSNTLRGMKMYDVRTKAVQGTQEASILR